MNHLCAHGDVHNWHNNYILSLWSVIYKAELSNYVNVILGRAVSMEIYSFCILSIFTDMSFDVIFIPKKILLIFGSSSYISQYFFMKRKRYNSCVVPCFIIVCYVYNPIYSRFIAATNILFSIWSKMFWKSVLYIHANFTCHDTYCQ